MRIIIYLASHDGSAIINNDRLTDVRMKEFKHQAFSVSLEVQNEKLVQDPQNTIDPFEHIMPEHYNKVKIELVAHGNPHHKHEILSLPLRAQAAVEEKKAKEKISREAKNSNVTSEIETQEAAKKLKLYPDKPIEIDEESGLTYDDISPQMLFDFFNNNPKCKDNKTQEFKFQWLTLFACTSMDFALKLSTLFKKAVIITAHEHEIEINDKGIALLVDHTTVSTPHQFRDGIIDPPGLPVYQFEFQTKTQALEDSLLGDFGKTSLRAPRLKATSSSSPITSSPTQSPQSHFSSLNQRASATVKTHEASSSNASSSSKRK
jgi:hypothetical protein